MLDGKGEEYKGKKKWQLIKGGKEEKNRGDFKRDQKDQIRKERLKRVMNEEKKKGKGVKESFKIEKWNDHFRKVVNYVLEIWVLDVQEGNLENMKIKQIIQYFKICGISEIDCIFESNKESLYKYIFYFCCILDISKIFFFH